MWGSDNKKPTSPVALTVEAWSEGFTIGAILLMLAITVANMRKGVPLHKVIFIEVRRLPYLEVYVLMASALARISRLLFRIL